MCLDGVCGAKPSIHTTQRVKNLTAERFVRSHSEASPVSQKVSNAETQLQLEAVMGGSQPSSLPSASLTSTEAQQGWRASRRSVCTAGLFLSKTPDRRSLLGQGRRECPMEQEREEEGLVGQEDIQAEGKT